jgi:hypothetical protein
MDCNRFKALMQQTAAILSKRDNGRITSSQLSSYRSGLDLVASTFPEVATEGAVYPALFKFIGDSYIELEDYYQRNGTHLLLNSFVERRQQELAGLVSANDTERNLWKDHPANIKDSIEAIWGRLKDFQRTVQDGCSTFCDNGLGLLSSDAQMQFANTLLVSSRAHLSASLATKLRVRQSKNLVSVLDRIISDEHMDAVEKILAIKLEMHTHPSVSYAAVRDVNNASFVSAFSSVLLDPRVDLERGEFALSFLFEGMGDTAFSPLIEKFFQAKHADATEDQLLAEGKFILRIRRWNLREFLMGKLKDRLQAIEPMVGAKISWGIFAAHNDLSSDDARTFAAFTRASFGKLATDSKREFLKAARLNVAQTRRGLAELSSFLLRDGHHSKEARATLQKKAKHSMRLQSLAAALR